MGPGRDVNVERRRGRPIEGPACDGFQLAHHLVMARVDDAAGLDAPIPILARFQAQCVSPGSLDFPL